MKRPNPYPAALMKSSERRAELCRILALGLLRLLSRQSSDQSATGRESSLHLTPDRSGHATRPKRRNA